MSDNRETYRKMSDNREIYENKYNNKKRDRYWQFLEAANSCRARLETPPTLVTTGLLVQQNLVARQTLALIEDYEAGRRVL